MCVNDRECAGVKGVSRLSKGNLLLLAITHYSQITDSIMHLLAHNRCIIYGNVIFHNKFILSADNKWLAKCNACLHYG